MSGFKRGVNPMAGFARPKPMNARLEWKGRKLMCNGVCVAKIFADSPGDWVAVGGVQGDRHEFWKQDFMSPMTESAARRAVNRRFGLREES